MVFAKYTNTLNNLSLKHQMHYTPGNIRISSKHVLSIFDDGNRVISSITPAVKGTGSPAVLGGAVTQDPFSVQFNNRRQELRKVTFERCIPT